MTCARPGCLVEFEFNRMTPLKRFCSESCMQRDWHRRYHEENGVYYNTEWGRDRRRMEKEDATSSD